MAKKSTRAVTIKAPVEKVFAFLADPTHWMLAIPNTEVTDTKLTSQGVGTTARWAARILGVPMSVVHEYIEFVPNQRIVSKANSGFVLTFTVAGEPRQGALHATQATVRAIGPVGNNKWAFTQRGSQPIEWLRFANSAKELHFLDMSGVKPSTTPAMVRKALQSNGNPKFFTGQSLSFDVISPGVTVAIKGPVDAGRYLLDCFIPSETDGMPHALMGMWKLVDVK